MQQYTASGDCLTFTQLPIRLYHLVRRWTEHSDRVIACGFTLVYMYCITSQSFVAAPKLGSSNYLVFLSASRRLHSDYIQSAFLSLYIYRPLTETYSNLSRVTSTMAASSNTGAEDLNQETSLSDTNPRTADSVGKTFLRNVKEKWDNVPQGWAQKRTNSADTDSTPAEEDVTSLTHEDSTPGGEETQ